MNIYKKNLIKCCGEPPRINDSTGDPDRLAYDSIECQVCYRIVFGIDEDNVKEWNDGINDFERGIKQCLKKITQSSQVIMLT